MPTTALTPLISKAAILQVFGASFDHNTIFVNLISVLEIRLDITHQGASIGTNGVAREALGRELFMIWWPTQKVRHFLRPQNLYFPKTITVLSVQPSWGPRAGGPLLSTTYT